MKKILLTLFLALVLLQVVVAETTINVKTIPYHKAEVVLFDDSTGEFQTIERTFTTTDKYGDGYVKTKIVQNFKIAVFVKTINGNDKVGSKMFEEIFSSGGEINLEIPITGYDLVETPEKTDTPEISQEIPLITNQTPETNNATEKIPLVNLSSSNEPANEGNAKMTNFVIFGDGGILSTKRLYYIGGGILLLVILVIVIRVIKHNRPKKEKEIIIRKLSEIRSGKDDLKENAEKKEDELKELHEQLKSIQEEVIKLKKEKNPQNHNEELQRRIEEKKKQVMKEEAELLKLRNEMKGNQPRENRYREERYESRSTQKF